MIIYEVNLTINNDIFDEYYTWLIKHIEIMLQFNGFHQAEISEEKYDKHNFPDKKKLTVRYTLEREEDLDMYLKNYATEMREDGIKKFGDKFSAIRRIFLQPLVMKI